MKRISALVATAVLALLTTIGAHAAGDPAAGKQKSKTCASCHGPKGKTDNSMYPKLAGQHASYLYHSLKAYKSGDRQNAVMAGLVSNLSEQDMRDLAAYYSSIDGGLYTLPLNNADQ